MPLKTQLAWQDKPSVSLLCCKRASYSPPYYTEWTITAGPTAATGWHRTGPICGMKHQAQLHLCVFSHPSSPFVPSPPHVLPHCHPPALSSAPGRIKSLSIVTQMRELLFICNKLCPIVRPAPPSLLHLGNMKEKNNKKNLNCAGRLFCSTNN